VGGYGLDQARTLDQLADRFEVLPLAQAAAAAFPGRNLSAEEARRLANGGRLAAVGDDAATGDGATGDAAGGDAGRGAEGAGRGHVPDPRAPTAAYAPDGTLVALVTEESGQARPLVVFA
jgi:tRNA pseudouridine55 synthase